jgi:calcium-dependent protein kinase
MKNIDHKMELMRIMDHPSIVKPHAVFADQQAIHLLTEFCAGSPLIDHILAIKERQFTERSAAICMQQIFSAMAHLHERHVCHADVNLDTFVFVNTTPVEQNVLKLTELTSLVASSGAAHAKCSTPYCSSPQTLAGRSLNEAANMWSVGVIMYIILCGYPPFHGETEEHFLDVVRNGAVSFPASHWAYVSEDAQMLLRHLLKTEPQERASASKALHHTWTRHTGTKHQDMLQPQFLKHLRWFRSMGKLKKLVPQIAARGLSDRQIQELRDYFLIVDRTGDGTLALTDLQGGLIQAGLREIPADVEEVIKDVNLEHSSVVDHRELLAATLDRKQHLNDCMLWETFTAFDQDGDGKVSLQELEQILTSVHLQKVITPCEVTDILSEVKQDRTLSLEFQQVTAKIGDTAKFEV